MKVKKFKIQLSNESTLICFVHAKNNEQANRVSRNDMVTRETKNGIIRIANELLEKAKNNGLTREESVLLCEKLRIAAKDNYCD